MNRRDFLKSIGSMAAGLPAVGLLAKIPAQGGIVKPPIPSMLKPEGEVILPITYESFGTNQTWDFSFYAIDSNGKKIHLKNFSYLSDGTIEEIVLS